MKLSVMSYTFSRQGWKKDGRFDLEGMCRVAQELGIDGADIVTTHELKPQEIRKVLSDSGIAPVCYTFLVTALNAATAAERRAGVDQVKSGVEFAAAIGAKLVMLVTPGQNSVPRDVARGQYIQGLQESADFARQAGIMASIENFPGADSPFVIAADILEAIRAVPGLKLTFDNGNALQGEDPASSFSRCAKYVVHAHFKDWAITEPGKGTKGLDGRYYEGALIGEGIVPHRACLEAMKRADYRGYINLEYEGNKYPPDKATRRAAKYLQALMAELA